MVKLPEVSMFDKDSMKATEWLKQLKEYIEDNRLSDEEAKNFFLEKIPFETYNHLQNLLEPKMISDSDVSIKKILDLFGDLYRYYRSITEYGLVEENVLANEEDHDDVVL
uniref:NudC domain-containing protein 1 n=1 Tax=Strongyloides stercoralis TaxID=6248 RepID=A0A0K0EDL7_STRER